jgi:hypothetical protein
MIIICINKQKEHMMATISKSNELYAKKDLTGTENNLINEDAVMIEAFEEHIEENGIYLENSSTGDIIIKKGELIVNLSVEVEELIAEDEVGDKIELDLASIPEKKVKEIVKKHLDSKIKETKKEMQVLYSDTYEEETKIRIGKEIMATSGEGFKEKANNYDVNNKPDISNIELTDLDIESIMKNKLVNDIFIVEQLGQLNPLLSELDEKEKDLKIFNVILKELKSDNSQPIKQ